MCRTGSIKKWRSSIIKSGFRDSQILKNNWSHGDWDDLNAVTTSFALPDEQVDGLRRAARELLNASPEFQRFLRELNE